MNIDKRYVLELERKALLQKLSELDKEIERNNNLLEIRNTKECLGKVLIECSNKILLNKFTNNVTPSKLFSKGDCFEFKYKREGLRTICEMFSVTKFGVGATMLSKGIARCNPIDVDEFDYNTGCRLAHMRAIINYYENAINEI